MSTSSTSRATRGRFKEMRRALVAIVLAGCSASARPRATTTDECHAELTRFCSEAARIVEATLPGDCEGAVAQLEALNDRELPQLGEHLYQRCRLSAPCASLLEPGGAAGEKLLACEGGEGVLEAVVEAGEDAHAASVGQSREISARDLDRMRDYCNARLRAVREASDCDAMRAEVERVRRSHVRGYFCVEHGKQEPPLGDLVDRTEGCRASNLLIVDRGCTEILDDAD